VEIGIFGNTGVGKSTLFRALAGSGEVSGQKKRAGVCVIKAPDDRVRRLAQVYQPEKTTFVSVAFHDIDAGEPDPLSTQAAMAIRDMEALVLVLRGFSDDYHPVPPGGLDPISEFRSISSSLVLSDYLIAQKRIERLAKEAKRDAEWIVLNKIVSMFEKGVSMRDIGLSAEEERTVYGFRFLSRLPVLLALNVNEADLGKEVFPELSRAAMEAKVPLLRLCAVVEEEIARISPEEQAEFIKEMGTGRSAKDRLVRTAFDAMRYISFMTVGEDEVRAWTIEDGTNARSAAGKIHSDIERGFIRAETVNYDDLIAKGTYAACKDAGLVRLEGKEYIVQEGDIILFRFNV